MTQKISFIVMVFFCSLVFAKVSFIAVEVEGRGLSYGEAVADALTQAVSQVNGVDLKAKVNQSQFASIKDSNGIEDSQFEERLSHQVETLTKGQIKDFTILDKFESTDGAWEVRLNVRVPKYKASKQSNRLRIAVMPLRIDGSTNAIAFEGQLNERLVSQLTKTRKFAVLDRDYQKSQSVELDSISAKTHSIDELSRVGNKLSADYMIAGVVNRVIMNSRNIISKTSGKKFPMTDYSTSLSYRIIDIATGQVKYADTYRVSFSMSGETDDFGPLVDKVSSSIVTTIMNVIYPLMIESMKGELVFLGQGGGLVQKGAKYKIIQLGDNLNDSYTGETLGRMETEVGILEIIDVQSRFSQGRILESSIDLKEKFIKRGFILRPIALKKGSTLTTIKKIDRQSEKDFETFDDDNNTQW